MSRRSTAIRRSVFQLMRARKLDLKSAIGIFTSGATQKFAERVRRAMLD